jgi:hypothetical protein
MIIFRVQHAAEISGIVNILDWLRYDNISFGVGRREVCGDSETSVWTTEVPCEICGDYCD